MSLIRVDNFGPSAGGTTYSARGVAAAWVNFNGTGTVAVRDSENVSSLTDNGTGSYNVNYTNNFAAVDYTTVFGGRIAVSALFAFLAGGNDGQYVNLCSIITRNLTADTDADIVTLNLNGDLA